MDIYSYVITVQQDKSGSVHAYYEIGEVVEEEELEVRRTIILSTLGKNHNWTGEQKAEGGGGDKRDKKRDRTFGSEGLSGNNGTR